MNNYYILFFQYDYFVINQYLWEWFILNYGGGPEIRIDGYNSSLFSIEEDTSKNENIIENNGTVITYIKGDDNTSNLGYSELNPDKKDATNKINSLIIIILILYLHHDFLYIFLDIY